tara:strand:+ start:704 stop:931 length:228 start_codon:yes stop_codon:yes gene_type:complete
VAEAVAEMEGVIKLAAQLFIRLVQVVEILCPVLLAAAAERAVLVLVLEATETSMKAVGAAALICQVLAALEVTAE